MLEHVPKHGRQTHIGRAEKVSACREYLLCCYEFRQPDMRTWTSQKRWRGRDDKQSEDAVWIVASTHAEGFVRPMSPAGEAMAIAGH